MRFVREELRNGNSSRFGRIWRRNGKNTSDVVVTCLRVQRLNVSGVKLDSFKFKKTISRPKRAEWKVLKKMHAL